VDAHIHLWDLSRFHVPVDRWQYRFSISPYVLQDSKAQSAGLSVGTMVYVQAAWASEYSLLEADYVTSLAAHDSLVQGMVAYAPLEYGEQVGPISTHSWSTEHSSKVSVGGCQVGPIPKFPWIVHSRDPDLPEYGLSFDILGKGTANLDMAINIAQSAAGIRADHRPLAEALHQAARDGAWHTKMAQLASFPNVYTKISGIGHGSGLNELERGRFEAYVDDAIKLFGEDRVVLVVIGRPF